ncbi:DNA repair protein RAD51 homolog 4 isoform X3 [Desmodus rotundus]|uniref:DNA repair protein RAD51 homolog 4 isoform X3 n=1 Tax=Desmodus rotundus TaxID=9430 RepID=UPI0023813C2A|nr:DNA repair protein RAD51 homolog 4 isoform X3 [Desmodus rotundus]
MALPARFWSVEAGSGGGAGLAGLGRRGPGVGPHHPRRLPPVQKGAPRGVWRGRCGRPRDAGPGSPGNMGVLRAGLCPGLTQDMVQLLRSHGIKTVADLVSADLEEVAQKCGLSYKVLVALRRVLLAQFSAFPFNGADLYEELKTSTAILSTGIGSLDKLLDAGLYTGEVTEIVGVPGSGKTQVCLCVAANVAHGLQQNVLYIDSNGGLTASRILQLLQARTPDEGEQPPCDIIPAWILPTLSSRETQLLAYLVQAWQAPSIGDSIPFLARGRHY